MTLDRIEDLNYVFEYKKCGHFTMTVLEKAKARRKYSEKPLNAHKAMLFGRP